MSSAQVAVNAGAPGPPGAAAAAAGHRHSHSRRRAHAAHGHAHHAHALPAARAARRRAEPDSSSASSGEEGATPLMYACQQGRELDVRTMLQSRPSLALERDRTGKTALHYCAEQAGPAAAAPLLQVAPQLLDAKDLDGYSALTLAVIAGNRALVRYLLARGADVDAQDNEKHSVVHWATVCGEAASLELVLGGGARASTPDLHGGYPLHYAAQLCGPQGADLGLGAVLDRGAGLAVLRALLASGAPVGVHDQDGRQPILWAASAGSADAILALVNAGANVEADDKDGLTALHCAASRGHTDCVETLVGLCGADVDVIDSNGCTALFYAVTLGHADCTRVLLAHGAEPNRQDRKGRTAAHCGAAKGQLETLRILATHGANLWLRNVRGDFPLHDAVQSGRRDLVLWLLQQRPDAVNAPNNDGRCPLHIAALHNNVEMCKVLLDCRALLSPVMRSPRQQLLTPLDAALHRGNRGVAKYLQLHGGVPANRLTEKTAQLRGGGHRLTISEPAGLNSPDSAVQASHAARNRSVGNSPASVPAAHGETRTLQVRLNDDVAIRHVEHIDAAAAACHHGRHGESSDDGEGLRGPGPGSGRGRRKKSRKHDRGSSSDILRWREREREDKQRSSRSASRAPGDSRRATSAASAASDDSESEADTEGTRERERERERSRRARSRAASEGDKRVRYSDAGGEVEAELQLARRGQAKQRRGPRSDEAGGGGDQAEGQTEEQSQRSAVRKAESAPKKRVTYKAVARTSTSELDGDSDRDSELERSRSRSRPDRDRGADARPHREGGGANSDASSEDCKKHKDDAHPSPAGRAGKGSRTARRSGHKKDAEHAASYTHTQVTATVTLRTERVEHSECSEHCEHTHQTEQGESAGHAEFGQDVGLANAHDQPAADAESPEENDGEGGPRTTVVTALVHREDGPAGPEVIREEVVLVQAEPLPPREDRDAGEAEAAGPVEVTAASDSGKASSEDKSKSDDAEASDNSMETSAENSPRQLAEGTAEATETSSEDHPQDAPALEGEVSDRRVAQTSTLDRDAAVEGGDGDEGGEAPSRGGHQETSRATDSKTRSRERKGRGTARISAKETPRDGSLEGKGSRGRGRSRGATAAAGRRPAGRLGRHAGTTQASKALNHDVDHDVDCGGADPGGVVNGDDVETVMGSDAANLRLKAAEAEGEAQDGDDDEGGSDPSTGRSHNNDQLVDSGLEPSPRREKPSDKDAASADSSPARGEHGDSRVPRMCRRKRERSGSAGETEEATVSVTRAVQLSMRKYHLERRIFHELLELKRLQIRAGRANEQVLVKRLVDDYRRAGLGVGLQPFAGTYTFRSFEKYLYDQLRALQSDNRRVIPRLQSSDDLEKLTAALRRTRQVQPASHQANNPLQCTASTHRCHHAVHAYSGVPCAAYIPKLNHHYMPKDGLYSGFLPHIEGASARPSLSSRTAPVTLELSHGPEKQIISLPTEHLDKNKRYYVTFTIKGGPQGAQASSLPTPTPVTPVTPSHAQPAEPADGGTPKGTPARPANKSF